MFSFQSRCRERKVTFLSVSIIYMLIFFAGTGFSAAPLPQYLQDIWDMQKIREAPLGTEKLSSHTSPYLADGDSDWVNQGDSWVAPSKKGAAKPKTPQSNKNLKLLVEEFYINSEMTKDGPNKIFCALARPDGMNKPIPAVLVFHGGGGHASGGFAAALARRNPGIAILAMDYNGQYVPSNSKTTIWKNVDRSRDVNLIPDIKNHSFYHYVIAARRAIDFLETQPEIDKNRIGCVGISFGGWVALTLAGVDNRIKCVVNMVSAGGIEGTQSRAAAGYNSAPAEQKKLLLDVYDPIAYAPYTNAAVFLNVCSNDRFFWLSGAGRNYLALAGDKRILIRPNSDHNCGGPDMPDPSVSWIRHILYEDKKTEAPRIKNDLPVQNGNVYSWEASGPYPISKSTLYWSPGNVVSVARYWVAIEAVQKDGKWQAELPAEYADLAGEVYVTVFDKKDRAASSITLKRDGIDPQKEASPLWQGNSIIDFERGKDAWRPLLGADCPEPNILNASCGGVNIGPAVKADKFIALSGSIVLASAHAANSKGIRLVVDGNGQAGQIKISIIRKCNSTDEESYSASADYSANESAIDMPWANFVSSPKSAKDKIWPFDTLQISGTRSDGSALTLKKVELFR